MSFSFLSIAAPWKVVLTTGEPQNASDESENDKISSSMDPRVSLHLLPSKIAVAAYHDENNDGQLNRNRLGIPSERYGFSRNARGMTGPPSFQQCVISRPSVGKTVDLFVR